MNTAVNILNRLADYNYKKDVNPKLDEIIEVIRTRFNDFDIDELFVHDTSKREVIYTEIDEYYDCTDQTCSEYGLFDEISCGKCKHCQLVTAEVEKFRIEEKLTPDSSVRIVLTKHVDDDKESITFTTNSEYMYINTYIRTWTTGRRPQMQWKCVSQLKEAIV